MRCSYTVLAFAATALALPTAVKRNDDTIAVRGAHLDSNSDHNAKCAQAKRDHRPDPDCGDWWVGKYEGDGTPYDNGQVKDEHKWDAYKSANHASKEWVKDEHKKRDNVQDGPEVDEHKGCEGKRDSHLDGPDDGCWAKGKYEGPGTPYDDGLYKGGNEPNNDDDYEPDEDEQTEGCKPKED